jgi:4-carboxymuconolactone decarboxylase
MTGTVDGRNVNLMEKPSMRSTEPVDQIFAARRALIGLAMASVMPRPLAAAPNDLSPSARTISMTAQPAPPLTQKQLAIGPIAAATAIGDMPRLANALDVGLDAGLTVGEAKEILVQLYAYAGFPRALNALGELMKTMEDRSRHGRQDAPGREPNPVPTGRTLLELGTANQTKLSGAPVQGPLFDFAPAIDNFLKTHLFGDIFARDSLDWSSRELATVATLSALSGVESQLQSHVRISLNVGLTVEQLREFSHALGATGHGEASQRLTTVLDKVATEKKA